MVFIKRPLLLCFLFAINFSAASAEPVSAVADNGREVILNDNGEWEYASDDIYATTQDGKRIRLELNGKWQVVSDAEAPVYQPVPLSTPRRDTANFDNIQLSLDQIVIETKKETIGKNTRKRSNLVFYIDLEGTDVLPTPGSITVQDSKGRDYSVFSVAKGKAPIGNQPRVVVRANGAPRWWGVKFFTLQIAPNTLGNEKTIELRKTMDEVQNKDVSELPEA